MHWLLSPVPYLYLDFIMLLRSILASGVIASKGCDSPENNPDYNQCLLHTNDFYASCVVQCLPEDLTCASDCSREYEQKLQDCPCQSGCPDGCPCPTYDGCPPEINYLGKT